MKEIGIYVHIPFCIRKCKYCDFVSYENKEIKPNEYIEALKKSIDDVQKYINLEENIAINTIYFGGGTPSSVNSKLIVNILNTIKDKFNVLPNPEITIEINPGTVNLEKLEDYKKSGFNRISIGLQSANNEILKTIGRIHTYSEFENTYKLAKKIGFNNINVDLMLALPNQSLEDLVASLKKVIDLKPNHISLYSLILEENTELEKEIKSGKLELPKEEIERIMYHKTKKILEKNGYEHYEISNFAKKGFESKHNLNCWNQKEYLGFGLASSSYYNKKRFTNITNLEKYIKNIKEEKYSENIEINEIQKREDTLKEYMMLGFRKIKGISISEFENKFQINPLFYFRFEISKLVDEGLIKVDLDNIKLTTKGLDFANIVFEEFI